jgi:PAS domain S-box-containing protein
MESEIAEPRNIKKALTFSETRLFGIPDMSADAIISMDEDLRIHLFNQAAESMFGYGAEEVIGQPIDRLIPVRHRAAHETHVREFARSPDRNRLLIHRREIVGLRKDGTEFPAEASISKLVSGEEAIFTVTLRDITARKQAEEEKRSLEAQLRQNAKMEALGILAGGIAHDLNNVLVPVLGLTQLTLKRLPEDSLAYANLEKVFEAGERARNLVNQILIFSRADLPDRVPVSLDTIANDMVKFVRSTLPSTIEVRPAIEADAGTVLADPTQIGQVLLNLATNAMHAMGATGGTLEVALARIEVERALAAGIPDLEPGPHVRLTVRDTGWGMDEETLQRAFDPFSTTKGIGEGTGMGLAIVHGIVAKHEAAMTVASEPGKGTTFEIYFPIWTGEAAAQNDPAIGDLVPTAGGRQPETASPADIVRTAAQ